jgi:hypothetical protein
MASVGLTDDTDIIGSFSESSPRRLAPLHRSRFWRAVAVAGALVLGVTPAPAAAAAPLERSPVSHPVAGSAADVRYTLTDLGTLQEGTASFGLGLARQGDVVGTSRTSADRLPQLATRREDGQAVSLGTLPGGAGAIGWIDGLLNDAVADRVGRSAPSEPDDRVPTEPGQARATSSTSSASSSRHHSRVPGGHWCTLLLARVSTVLVVRTW